MPAPTSTRYYFTNTTFPGTAYGGTTLIPTTTVNTTWGWNVGQLTVNHWCQMDQGVEVSRTSTQWTTVPTASAPNNSIGNCFVMGPFNGDFSATMSISMSVKATTNQTGQDGRFIYRFWCADNYLGTSNPKDLFNIFYSSSIVINARTTPTVLSASVNSPSFSLHGQWLFLHTQWDITGPATSQNADINFVFGAASASILLPMFTPHNFYSTPFLED